MKKIYKIVVQRNLQRLNLGNFRYSVSQFAENYLIL